MFIGGLIGGIGNKLNNKEKITFWTIIPGWKFWNNPAIPEELPATVAPVANNLKLFFYF
jgi:hypothetical protein